MKVITSEKMPKANGHYSVVLEHNGILYLSGQLPFDPKTRSMPDTIEGQAQQALSNIALVLKEAGSSKEQVLQMRVYISDIALWDKVNAVYADFFGDHKPARSVIPTRDLHFGCLIEIEATAFV